MEGSEIDISSDKISSCVLFCLFATEEPLGIVTLFSPVAKS